MVWSRRVTTGDEVGQLVDPGLGEASRPRASAGASPPAPPARPRRSRCRGTGSPARHPARPGCRSTCFSHRHGRRPPPCPARATTAASCAVSSACAAAAASGGPTQNRARGEAQAAWSNQYTSLARPSAGARRLAGVGRLPARHATSAANDERSGKVRSRAAGGSGWRRRARDRLVAAPDHPQVAGPAQRGGDRVVPAVGDHPLGLADRRVRVGQVVVERVQDGRRRHRPRGRRPGRRCGCRPARTSAHE